MEERASALVMLTSRPIRRLVSIAMQMHRNPVLKASSNPKQHSRFGSGTGLLLTRYDKQLTMLYITMLHCDADGCSSVITLTLVLDSVFRIHVASNNAINMILAFIFHLVINSLRYSFIYQVIVMVG